jgi:hypothetical protein
MFIPNSAASWEEIIKNPPSMFANKMDARIFVSLECSPFDVGVNITDFPAHLQICHELEGATSSVTSSTPVSITRFSTPAATKPFQNNHALEPSFNLVVYELNGIRWANALMDLFYTVINLVLHTGRLPPNPIPLLRVASTGLFLDIAHSEALLVTEAITGDLEWYSEDCCQEGSSYSVAQDMVAFLQCAQHTQYQFTRGCSFISNLRGERKPNVLKAGADLKYLY